jgi:hypothetical protein
MLEDTPAAQPVRKQNLTAQKSPVFHIYSDESSHQGKHRFLALGATFLRWDHARALSIEIDEIAASHANIPVREFHWKGMQKAHLKQYLALASLFSREVKRKRLRFSCVLVDNHKLDHQAHSKGDRELGLTKLTFGPIYSFAQRFGAKNTYDVFPDKRTTKHAQEDLVYSLNNRAKQDFPACRPGEPFRKVKPTDSGHSRLIQLTDVITGIIAYEKNGHHAALNPVPAPYKMAVWEHLKAELGLETLAKPTRGFLAMRFTIREFDFAKAKLPKAAHSRGG